MKVKLLSRVQLFATPWTIAYQAPPSMGFPRQEYWSGGAIALSTKASRIHLFHVAPVIFYSRSGDNIVLTEILYSKMLGFIYMMSTNVL